MNTSETLQLVKEAMGNPSDQLKADILGKAYTQGTGLVAYDLQPAALKLYPVITPLRNMIPRVAGNGGTATNWRAVTGVNTTKLAIGVSEGNRSAVITTSTQNYVAAYKGIGLEDNVSFEADYAAQGFDDVKALAIEGLLRAVMIGEEQLIIGGNGSLVSMGVTPTPTLVAAGSGSTLTNVAYNVYCVALGHQGLLASTLASGVLASVTRTNADGSSDTYGNGVAQISAIANITPAAGNNITASVVPVKGAVGYAWYWGTGAAAVLGAITTVSQVVISAAATGTQAYTALPAADNSQDALVFDGLISQICAPGSGAYYNALAAGATLTADGAAGIVEIDVALKSFWDNYRISPDMMLVSSQEILNMSKKIIANGGAPLFHFNENGGGQRLVAGAVLGSYLNKYTMSGGSMVNVMLHPNVPAGTIIFFSSKINYPLSGVSNLLQIKTRRDYYQLEWPLRSRKYEYGVYADEVLQNYFPPAFGMITNISNG